MNTNYGRVLLLVLVAGIMFPSLSAAQFFKYRDETGAIRFTDDISQVPPEQRPQVKLYEESVSVSTGEPERTVSETAANIPADDFDAREAEIFSRKAELDAEYDRLNAEMLAINEAKKTINVADTKQVEELNARINAYREGSAAYETSRRRIEADMAKLQADRAAHAAQQKMAELQELEKKK